MFVIQLYYLGTTLNDNTFSAMSERHYLKTERNLLQSKLYIEFNKDFQVSVRGDTDTKNGHYYEYIYKIAVYINEESYIIMKKQSEFRIFVQQINDYFL